MRPSHLHGWPSRATRSRVCHLRPSISHGIRVSRPTSSISRSSGCGAIGGFGVVELALDERAGGEDGGEGDGGVGSDCGLRSVECGLLLATWFCASSRASAFLQRTRHRRVAPACRRRRRAAVGAGFGADVDDPVGGFDDVEVVLDDDDRVAVVDEAVEHFEQFGEVVEVEAGRRFVEQVERLAGVGPSELGGEFHALGFAAGERRGALAEGEVVEADVAERLQDAADLGDVAEQLDGFAARHVEHVGDRSCRGSGLRACRGCSAGRGTFRTRPTRRAGSASGCRSGRCLRTLRSGRRHVEAEPPGRVAAELRFGELREQLANQVEHAGVRGRVRRRRVAQRLLIDADDLVDLLDAADRFVCAGDGARAVERFGELVVEDVFDERALAAAADAGDGGERAERNLDVDVLEVVVAGADDVEEA